MAKAKLTDLSIQRLKWDGKQTITWDTSLPGFGIRIGKHKKTFVVMVGKERRLVTVGHYPDDKLKDARTEAKREMLQTRRPVTNTETLKEIYLKEAKTRLAESTYTAYQTFLDTLDKEVDSLTLTDARDYLGQYVDTPTQQNHAFRSLRAFLNWCVREGHIEHHPLIRMPEPNRLQSRDRVLNDDELKAIWEYTDFRPFGHIVRCLILSGQRKMEIAKTTPEDVTDVLTISQTKNREPHVIPITPLLAEFLKPPFVFNGWSKSKARLDKQSGVTNWKLHDLRRTWATVCAKEKIEPHVIERVLNHKSGSIAGVAKIYNRYGYLDEMENALLKFENYLRPIITPKPSKPDSDPGDDVST